MGQGSMSDKPAITIGLPVRDNLVYLEEAIKSVYAQTFENWTLLIVCDGATPEIVQFVQSLIDPRVEVIIEDTNRGLANRLNQIASLAKTQYLARMDSDDIMVPSRLQTQFDFMKNNPDLDVLGTSNYLIDEESNLFGEYKEPTYDNSPSSFLNNGIFSHPSVIMKTEWAIRNPYDPKWIRTEDKELWLRTFDQSSFHKLEARLMFIRVPKQLDRDKFLLTSKYNRKLIRELGGKVAPKQKIIRLYVGNLMKALVFQALKLMRLDTMIYGKKFINLQVNESRLIGQELKIIRDHRIPRNSANDMDEKRI